MITYVLFSLTGGMPAIFLHSLENLIHLINRFSGLFANLPGSTLILGKPANGILLAIIFVLPIFFVLWEKKYKKWIFILPSIPLIMQMLIPFVNPYGKIIFIDVGQGDSILIQMPYNQGNYLIDTGGAIGFAREEWQERKQTFDPGRDVVLPLLKSEGITSLDKLILTHGDGDHIGGSAALFAEIKVKKLILPRLTERSSLEKEIVKQAGQEGTTIYFGGAGTSWRSADAEFKLLSPIEKSDDRNENSIVLFAEFGGKKWLFTGDLGVDGEQVFLDKYKGIGIDVLKVGHHGSKFSTSAEFIEELKPEYAIISVGMANRYGHPHAEILQRLEDNRIQTFRTDKNGAVIYVFKKESGTFSTRIP
jgi:competence protein ComEC